MSVQCKNCGAKIQYEANTQSLVCPYCNTKNEITKEEDKLPTEINQIIPLSVTQDALEKNVYAYMAEGDLTPDDMLESVTFLKRDCFYVPAYVFEVEFSANWTASFGYDRKEPYTDYRISNGRSVPYTAYRTVTDWRPVNGVDSGVFDVSAYAGTDLTAVELKPTNIVPHTVLQGERTAFRSEFIQNVKVEEIAVPEKLALSSLETEISEKITASVKNHAQGDRQRDWNWTLSSSNISTNTVCVPMCYAIFDYKGTNYHYWSDGINGKAFVADPLPIDEDRKKNIRLGFIPIGVSILSLILAYFLDKGAYSSFLGIRGVSLFGLTSLIITAAFSSIRRHSILAFSRKLRQALLTQINSSSSTNADLTEEEKEKLTQAYQRPEKPIFARTDKDKIVIPIVSILAFLIAILPPLLGKIRASFNDTLSISTYKLSSTEKNKVTVPEKSADQYILKADIDGYFEIRSGWGVINTLSEESGDWIPYFFKIHSSAGKKIVAVCRVDDRCKVTGLVNDISSKGMPVVMDDGFIPSAVFEIGKVHSVKLIPSSKTKPDVDNLKNEQPIIQESVQQPITQENVQKSVIQRKTFNNQQNKSSAVVRRNTTNNRTERTKQKTREKPEENKQKGILDTFNKLKQAMPKGELKEDNPWD